MRVVCSYCEKEGVPALIREKDPLDDPRITHGICRRHQVQVREEVEALWGHLPGRRRFGRFPISLAALGRSSEIGAKELHGTVRTVGAGGLMVEFPVEVPPGSTIHLVLQIQLGPLPVECRVVWTQASEGRVRHGLAFLEYMGKTFATDLFHEAHRSPPARSGLDRPTPYFGRRRAPFCPWNESTDGFKRRLGATLRPCQRTAGGR
jgi:hypothetical protein